MKVSYLLCCENACFNGMQSMLYGGDFSVPINNTKDCVFKFYIRQSKL